MGDDSLDVRTNDVELRRLVLRSPVRVAESASLHEAATVMREENVSCALVGERGNRVVTERDLAWALARCLGPGDLVEPISTQNPVCVTRTTTVSQAARTMIRHGMRHLIVVDEPGGEPVGVVSMRDLFPAHLFVGSGSPSP